MFFANHYLAMVCDFCVSETKNWHGGCFNNSIGSWLWNKPGAGTEKLGNDSQVGKERPGNLPKSVRAMPDKNTASPGGKPMKVILATPLKMPNRSPG
jgi:hypothetical protein